MLESIERVKVLEEIVKKMEQMQSFFELVERLKEGFLNPDFKSDDI